MADHGKLYSGITPNILERIKEVCKKADYIKPNLTEVSLILGEEYKDNVSKLDKMRTVNHNSVIANVNLLNRLAEKNGLQPVYDGIVSEERPYRREIANAVLDYVESIIKNRR